VFWTFIIAIIIYANGPRLVADKWIAQPLEIKTLILILLLSVLYIYSYILNSTLGLIIRVYEGYLDFLEGLLDFKKKNYQKKLDSMAEKVNRWNYLIDEKNEIIIDNSSTSLNKNIMIKNKDIEQVHIALTLNGIQLGNDKLYTLLAINNFIGGGTSSLLFQKLREEYGYVYTIYSFPSSYKNTGMYNIYFALNEQYIKNAIDIIHEIINDISKNKMTEVQVHKAKEQLREAIFWDWKVSQAECLVWVNLS
jgi:hypothetical protein